MLSNINRIEKLDILHVETFLLEDRIFGRHTTAYTFISFTLSKHRECAKCTLPSSIWRVLRRLFIKLILLLFLKYTRQQQPCNVFNRSTSHGFVAQNFRDIFSRRSRTHSNTWKSVGSLWTIDQSNSKISVWSLTTLTIDRYLCPRRESKAQSHKARGCNPTS